MAKKSQAFGWLIFALITLVISGILTYLYLGRPDFVAGWNIDALMWSAIGTNIAGIVLLFFASYSLGRASGASDIAEKVL